PSSSSAALWPQAGDNTTSSDAHETNRRARSVRRVTPSLPWLRCPRILRLLLRNRGSKKLLQIRERELQVQHRLQRLASEIPQTALRVEDAEDRRASCAIAFFSERLEIGRRRHEALLVRLDLPPLGFDARHRAEHVVLDLAPDRVALAAQLRRRRDRSRDLALIATEDRHADADGAPRPDGELARCVDDGAE